MKQFISTILIVFVTVGMAFGQHHKKSITDSIFQLEQANVKETIKKKVNLLNMDVPLKILPMTVTTLSSEVLERKNILNLEDAVKFLPGVTVSDQLGAFYRFSVRGSSEAVIAIDGFRDERSLQNTMPFGDISAVESIEVLKGPAAVLSGYSVMGGVINIVRKKATPDFSANARLSYGSWDMKSATLGFGGKLAGPLTYRANVHYSTGDGYRHVNSDRFSGIGVLAADLGNIGRFDVTVGFKDDKYDTEIGAAPTMPGDIFETAATSENTPFLKSGERNPFADYHKVYGDFANNDMTSKAWDISAQYVKKLTSFMDLRERFTYNHINTDYSCVEKMAYRVSNDPIYDFYYYNRKGSKVYVDLTDSLQSGEPLCFNPDSRGLTNTLELTGKLETGSVKHNYTFGYYYSFFNYTQYNGYNKGDLWGPGLYQLVSLSDPHTVRDWWDSKVSAANIQERRTSAVYLHDVLDISTKWKAMLSGRMDFYKYRSATATIDDGRQDYDKANRTDWKEVKTTAFTYRAGLVYVPVQPLSVYASFASHFKPITTMYDSKTIYLDRNGKEFNPHKDGGEVFKPEKGYQAEVGVRYMLNDLLELNGSIYYIRKNNVVKSLGSRDTVEDGATVTKTIRAQVGTADSRGFDIEVVIRPLPTLAITGGLGWQDYRTRKIHKSEDYPDFTEAAKNARATGIPRTTFYAYADYTIPKGVLKDLSFHLSGNFKDKVFRDVTNRIYYPALFLVDAGVFYTIKKHVTLALNIDNLFDKEYFKSMTVYGKPRNFTGTASYTF